MSTRLAQTEDQKSGLRDRELGFGEVRVVWDFEGPFRADFGCRGQSSNIPTLIYAAFKFFKSGCF